MSAGRDSSIESSIYVKILDEMVEVWRPVRAEALGGMVFRIRLDQPTFGEVWEFKPGETVVVENQIKSGGEVAIAVRRFDG